MWFVLDLLALWFVFRVEDKLVTQLVMAYGSKKESFYISFFFWLPWGVASFPHRFINVTSEFGLLVISSSPFSLALFSPIGEESNWVLTIASKMTYLG